MADIKLLQDEINKFIEDRDCSQFYNPKDIAISISIEVAELLEHFQWKNDNEMEIYLHKNKEAVADELADVLYWMLFMSNKFSINLSEAFEEKMQKNKLKYPVGKSISNHKIYTEL